MSDDDSSRPSGGDNGGANSRGVNDSTLNRALGVLANQRCRYTLEKLHDTPDGVASVDELSDYLIDHDPGVDNRNQVEVELHHRILPRLDATSLIDFDPRNNIVRYQGTGLIEDLLDFINKKK